MSTTARQNNLILNEDWTRIYQTFRNADFKSYDFENLRRVIITYLRENYPEDFNDYIESSEYLALIDAVAFLGQSLSFRLDLASRENFIELAERKDSVLRIAKMLSYNAKRNIPASGLMKFVNVSTTEDLTDSNGRNLAQQSVRWNDPTNTNWAEQFILILNAAMSDNTEFGRSQGTANIQNIPTEQYRFRSFSADVPIYSFSKSVAGRNMAFELVSTTFKDAEEIYEESPTPGNQLGFVYRQDGQGPGSANTGFYLQFKQGSLELADFSIDVPTTNEKVAVESQNINNDDVWLYSLDVDGGQGAEWLQVSDLVGNNIAYNSIVGGSRNIYAVNTKENDKVDLVFADGVYGNLPRGNFRTYYRVSNGLSYSISPNELRGINITVPYLNKAGQRHSITIGLALQQTVSSATPSEDIDSIRQNAPAQYYTQNRMITGEDYNLAPLSTSQNILKVKSVNRTSSGISRNIDIIDASGKYGSLNVFGDDGYVYKQESENTLSFKFTSRTDIINFIKNRVEKIFSNTDVYNFYITRFEKILFSETTIEWNSITNDTNIGTGYFVNNIDLSLLKVGTYATNNLKFVLAGASIKFTAPDGKAFKKGVVVDINDNDSEQTSYLWTKVQSVVGDGTNAGRGVLSTGLGPITFTDNIPSGAIATRIVPKFVTDISDAIETQMTNIAFANLNFGLRYDINAAQWKIIQAENLDLTTAFSLGKAGDVTSENVDASWIIAFVKDNDQYNVRVRKLDYVFGSIAQNRFYFDKNDKAYNNITGKLEKDAIKVLGINKTNTGIGSLVQDYTFEVSDTIQFDDGYESSQEIKLAFSDKDSDGVVDDPQSFENIVGTDLDLNFLFFKQETDSYGTNIFNLIDNSNDTILIAQRESQVNINDYVDGQLIYFYDANEDRVKSVNKTTNTFTLETSYKAEIGRRDLKFQYTHAASTDRRIDPSVTNIVDIFILTRAYDTSFRNYLAGVGTKPDEPTTEDLRIAFGGGLNQIKAISDEIIYHPVKYKVLFGTIAEQKVQAQFKVVKNPNKTINDNNLKVRIVNAMNTFFSINNWDFGDRFYLSELTAYVINSVSPDVTNFVILPRDPTQVFGSLFEIQSKPDEIFVSGASVDDIEIVSSITAAEIRAGSGTVVDDA
jgi:hypothetical protein|tara:strand:- start:41142 stop:44540 length:3399 start_codon:yes stop_codon:yes gene_type:complete